MNMSRKIASLTLVTMFLFLTAAKCKPEDSAKPKASATAPVKAPKDVLFPVPAGETPNAYEVPEGKGGWEGHRVAAISGWVEPEFGPMRITIDATDLSTGEHLNLIDAPNDLGMEIPAGQQFRLVFGWPAGDRVELNMHVKANKPGSQKGFLSVRPEGRRPGKKTEVFSGLAACNLYTVLE